MAESMVQPPDCSRKFGNCGNIYVSIAYFCIFTICGMYVLVNLFIAVILENFSNVINQDGAALNERSIQKYIQSWMRFDPHMTLYIDATQLPVFLAQIGEPLGVSDSHPHYKQHMNSLLKELKLREFGGKVHYQDLLMRLAHIRFGSDLPSDLHNTLSKRWNRLIPPQPESNSHNIHMIHAALKIQRIWRQKFVSKKLNNIQNQYRLAIPTNEDDIYENDELFSDLKSYDSDSWGHSIGHYSTESDDGIIEFYNIPTDDNLERNELLKRSLTSDDELLGYEPPLSHQNLAPSLSDRERSTYLQIEEPQRFESSSEDSDSTSETHVLRDPPLKSAQQKKEPKSVENSPRHRQLRFELPKRSKSESVLPQTPNLTINLSPPTPKLNSFNALNKTAPALSENATEIYPSPIISLNGDIIFDVSNEEESPKNNTLDVHQS
eukprot:CAMPEP_0117419474 /NCGR_PEP_ID=MMETSP0758-20121206/1019_1 /TAXON_ID=63605 /ORGANISM="Percolomonas cosmopolitus, Strain AE-1 (ATCC 50343)" /LENGTH=435 /DNA_ID=CAMNT_0005200541 /DNA_START=1846 /DNA_END=3150 /DNA_ORIENTATION=+